MARKRKSGTGTIRQRKDGRWEGRAVVGYDDKGLPKTKNVLAKSKHECQEKLTKLMEAVGNTKSEKIGADWYAKDAKRSADIAKEFFGV